MIKTLFMGRKWVAASCLSWLCDQPEFEIIGVLTDSHLVNSCTAELAIKKGIPLLEYEEALKIAEEQVIDLGISILYWRKLKGALLLQESKYGCINFHPALLPEYKGCAGYNLAILENLSKWGSSCHYVDSNIDTGEIIDISEFSIDPEIETAQSLERKTLVVMETQFKLIADKLRKLGSGRLDSRPNTGGRYFSRQDMERLKQVLPGDDPDLKARAFYFPPYDGAWVMVNGRRMNIIPEIVLRSLGDSNTSSLFSPSLI